ncbi:MAG TPA: peptidoglycan-binding domain-containing protein, partial [Opitutales bacterium]|nr:peptidoglycan-binding domain-containing protein [Opitutales bacterium]
MKKKKNNRRQPRKTFRLLVQISLGGLIFAAVYFLLGPDNIAPKEDLPPPGRPVENSVELQIALARFGFSPGSVDGNMGKQTKQALAAFRKSRGLPDSGQADPALDKWLRIEEPTHAYMELTKASLRMLAPKPSSWRERGRLAHLGYHSILEMVAEKSCADPDYIRAINPEVDWSGLRAGDRVFVPLIPAYRIGEKIDHIQIELGKRQLQAFSASNKLIFHSPVSIARDVAKRPVGKLEVKVRVDNPNYTFNPEILSAAARRENITKKFII